MRSAMASAWARSSLSLRKARSLNSPGGRADAVDLQDAADQHVEDDGATMALQLQHVFASEAVGALNSRAMP